jgi:prevent-host-death family protein
MANVNMLEAKTNLSKLVEEALHGGEVIICRDGKPAVKLVPVEPRRPRVPGSAKGLIWISPDFDAPMTDEEFDTFVGS